MMKGRTQQILMLAAIAVVIYLLCVMNKSSNYSITEKEYSVFGSTATTGPSTATTGMQKGTGLASSLLPREVASQENFGEFAPEDILAGQNFLEVRDQIGIPETTGGALRNANQSIRAEPPNPKVAFTWNNSTINTDNMQRPLV